MHLGEILGFFYLHESRKEPLLFSHEWVQVVKKVTTTGNPQRLKILGTCLFWRPPFNISQAPLDIPHIKDVYFESN